MKIGLLFWILWVLWVLFAFGVISPPGITWGGTLLMVVLFGLLGWQVFGPVLQK